VAPPRWTRQSPRCKREFADLGQRQARLNRFADPATGEESPQAHPERLADDDKDDEAENHAPRTHHQRGIKEHTDRDEEDGGEHVAERLDLVLNDPREA
jgi:hypothetical protein